MGNRDNIWICLSDLLAGIMAFFIFVSAGIYVEYTGLEAIAYGEIAANLDQNGTGPGVYPIKLPYMVIPGGEMESHIMSFKQEFFGSDIYKLSPEKKKDLEKFIVVANKKLAGKKAKILILGHASCVVEIDDEQLIARVKRRDEDWKSMSALAQVNERHAALFEHNHALSQNRAFEIFSAFWDDNATKRNRKERIHISNNGRSNIRYIGLSERSEERRVGKECLRPCRERRAPYN